LKTGEHNFGGKPAQLIYWGIIPILTYTKLIFKNSGIKIGENCLLFIVDIIMALSSAIADQGITCDTKCSACIADPDDAEGHVQRLKCREPPV